MPDISYSVIVNVNAGALSSNLVASNVTSDFATSGFLALTLNVGTATQAIGTSSASSLGLCFARSLNTVTTHTVSFGRLSGTTLFEVVRMIRMRCDPEVSPSTTFLVALMVLLLDD